MKYHKMQESKFRLPVAATDATSELVFEVAGQEKKLGLITTCKKQIEEESMEVDNCRKGALCQLKGIFVLIRLPVG